eukprot:5755330-Lingulodinium_polyedra.AAC.1
MSSVGPSECGYGSGPRSCCRRFSASAREFWRRIGIHRSRMLIDTLAKHVVRAPGDRISDLTARNMEYS